jgi:hypothetical protein
MAQIIRAGSPDELAEFLVGRHPSTANVFQHFTYSHLPPYLAAASAPICGVAAQMVDLLPDGPELTAGLRKLLEAKDCMARAMAELHRCSIEDDPLDLKARLEANAAALIAAIAAAHEAAADARADLCPCATDDTANCTPPTLCPCVVTTPEEDWVDRVDQGLAEGPMPIGHLVAQHAALVQAELGALRPAQ